MGDACACAQDSHGDGDAICKGDGNRDSSGTFAEFRSRPDGGLRVAQIARIWYVIRYDR